MYGAILTTEKIFRAWTVRFLSHRDICNISAKSAHAFGIASDEVISSLKTFNARAPIWESAESNEMASESIISDESYQLEAYIDSSDQASNSDSADSQFSLREHAASTVAMESEEWEDSESPEPQGNAVRTLHENSMPLFYGRSSNLPMAVVADGVLRVINRAVTASDGGDTTAATVFSDGYTNDNATDDEAMRMSQTSSRDNLAPMEIVSVHEAGEARDSLSDYEITAELPDGQPTAESGRESVNTAPRESIRKSSIAKLFSEKQSSEDRPDLSERLILFTTAYDVYLLLVQSEPHKCTVVANLNGVLQRADPRHSRMLTPFDRLSMNEVCSGN